MANNKKNKALDLLLAGILCLLVGIAAIVLSLVLGAHAEDKSVYNIIMYAGAGIAALGLITLIVGIVSIKKHGKNSKEQLKSQSQTQQQPEQNSAEKVADVKIELDGSATYNYTPVQTETYEFVTVGRRQSLDDKFEQIGKMGKTQFVIYIAKLFSLKGYEVQLTPVIDNNNIDMLVKHDGITRAVGCLITNKVMCEEDIKPIYEGKSFYDADGVMVVTNMYFDRTSLDFAKAHKITLVDRHILSEQYMN